MRRVVIGSANPRPSVLRLYGRRSWQMLAELLLRQIKEGQNVQKQTDRSTIYKLYKRKTYTGVWILALR